KSEWLQRVADIHGLDPEDIDEIAELCLEDAENNISILKGVQRGQDLSDAIRAAHSIKGASSNIQLNDLSDAARTIESKLRGDDFTDFESNLSTLEEKYEEFKQFYNS
ncbi:MAG: Hpt domain-containing protein, partial [Lentisphaeraceae bacterium]|nr:Hpt domain-containing protein [Lentisphaeraceae bacterium]